MAHAQDGEEVRREDERDGAVGVRDGHLLALVVGHARQLEAADQLLLPEPREALHVRLVRRHVARLEAVGHVGVVAHGARDVDDLV
ncbi:hypothetical protein EG866_15740, partial [Enterococcus faecalis]